MHELSVCRAVMAEIEAVADRHGVRAVARVNLRVGALSGVEPALLRTAFAVASRGTCAEGAALSIDETPLRVECESCGAQTAATPNRLTCADCGAWRTRLISGDELTLISVELVSAAPAGQAEAQGV
jgi:hydrogenase nickel incorporation protein HypA/HybF